MVVALTIYQQIQQLLEEKKTILLTFPAQATVDAIASAIALGLFLQKIGKDVELVADGFTLPQSLRFLPLANEIKSAFPHLQKFVLTLDVSQTGVESLTYDIKDGRLQIVITPKQGILKRDQVRTTQTDWRYDLIITLGARDLASLGVLYANNTDLFFKTPIINLDYHASNEHFGHINLVPLSVASIAEVVFDLIKKMGEEYMDDTMATAVLTGMIAATRSFKADAIKPQTMATASTLMTLGANRENIVNALYRTRSVATLKLWGFTLTHLEADASLGLVWSSVTHDDFTRSEASEKDLHDMIDEILSNVPAAKRILLLHEESMNTQPVIHGWFRAHHDENAKELLAPWRPDLYHNEASFTVTGKNLKAVEADIIAHLRQQWSR